MIRHICFFSLIVSAGLWTGCGSRTSLNSQQESFLLEASVNPQRVPAPVDGILKIRYCRAAAPFDGQYFLYRTQTGQYQQDYYKLFLTPPNEQMGELLGAWLEQSGAFRGVLPASSSAESDYVLEPTLGAIYSDFSEPTQPKTVFKMRIVLLKMNKTRQVSEVVMENMYDKIEPLQNNTSREIIKNYSLSLEQFLTQLQSDIVSILPKRTANE
jgi:ABC-type uncharacterized transport system auxiliary subunit